MGILDRMINSRFYLFCTNNTPTPHTLVVYGTEDEASELWALMNCKWLKARWDCVPCKRERMESLGGGYTPTAQAIQIARARHDEAMRRERIAAEIEEHKRRLKEADAAQRISNAMGMALEAAEAIVARVVADNSLGAAPASPQEISEAFRKAQLYDATTAHVKDLLRTHPTTELWRVFHDDGKVKDDG